MEHLSCCLVPSLPSHHAVTALVFCQPMSIGLTAATSSDHLVSPSPSQLLWDEAADITVLHLTLPSYHCVDKIRGAEIHCWPDWQTPFCFYSLPAFYKMLPTSWCHLATSEVGNFLKLLYGCCSPVSLWHLSFRPTAGQLTCLPSSVTIGRISSPELSIWIHAGNSMMFCLANERIVLFIDNCWPLIEPVCSDGPGEYKGLPSTFR